MVAYANPIVPRVPLARSLLTRPLRPLPNPGATVVQPRPSSSSTLTRPRVRVLDPESYGSFRTIFCGGELFLRAVARPLAGARDVSKASSTLCRSSACCAFACVGPGDRERDLCTSLAIPPSSRRPRGVACMTAYECGRPARDSFGVDGERCGAVFPEEEDKVDVREFADPVIWRREKHAGRLARLRVRFVFAVIVEPLSFVLRVSTGRGRLEANSISELYASSSSAEKWTGAV